MFQEIINNSAFILLFIIFLKFAKLTKKSVNKYDIDHEIEKNDNLGLSIILCGYYLGLMSIYIGALEGPSQGFQQDMISVITYSLLGLIFRIYLNNLVIELSYQKLKI